MKTVIRTGGTREEQQILTGDKSVRTLIDEHLHRYLSENFDSERPRRDILKGLPVVVKTDTWDSYIAFRSSDFRRYLEKKDVYVAARDLAPVLRALGLQPTQLSTYVKGTDLDSGMRSLVTRAWMFGYGLVQDENSNRSYVRRRK